VTLAFAFSVDYILFHILVYSYFNVINYMLKIKIKMLHLQVLQQKSYLTEEMLLQKMSDKEDT